MQPKNGRDRIILLFYHFVVLLVINLNYYDVYLSGGELLEIQLLDKK